MPTVLTRSQAKTQGTTYATLRHNVATGRWQRVFPGVFLTHSGTITWRERVRAAALARGRGAVVSLECALRLWNLTDREPPIITLAEPQSTRRTGTLPGVRVRRRRRLAPGLRYGIPVTSAAQTVLDVVALPSTCLDDTLALITRAVATRRVTLDELRAELGHHPRHPKRQLLTQVLTAALDGLESAAEVRYVRDVEEAHGLPSMDRQAPLEDPDAGASGRTRRMDFRDAERRIRMEVDGELYHRERQKQDRARDRQAAGQNETALRAGWAEIVATPCEVAADVAVVQIARGWTGRPHGCGPGCAVTEDPRLRVGVTA
ncbi:MULTISPECIES: hypothetical protein [unclassified Ornithinimicrobium]|uniref:hypothetical protein n=1 Tax=unclassified Ornithinimicrobium TaxID=2615080 RepID=UPI003851A382